MPPGPSFSASIHEIITDALAASEEQLSAMRSEALLELDRLRRDATEQARQRVRDGEAAAEAMLRSAERAGAELRASIGAAVGEARAQIELLEGELGGLGAASSSLAAQLGHSRERLDDVEVRLRRIPATVEGEVAAEPVSPPLADPVSPPVDPPQATERPDSAPDGGAHDGDHLQTGEAAPAPPAFRTQRRLAFSAAETRLAATALTNAAVDKLDLVEELVASPNFSAEERSLSLMVLLREAEQLSRMAAQFGRPPLDLTERLLELRRRATRLLHGDDPQGD